MDPMGNDTVRTRARNGLGGIDPHDKIHDEYVQSTWATSQTAFAMSRNGEGPHT